MLRLICEVIDAGRRSGVPVSMCGEMAGDLRFLPLLLGMGLREFSMQPAAILDIRERMLSLDTGELTRAVRNMLSDPEQTDPYTRLAEYVELH